MKSEIIVRENNRKYEEASPKGAAFLYENIIGRVVLSLANKRFISGVVGKYMNSKYSIKHIEPFIKSNKLDMKDYPKVDYSSFNDFFSRKIINGKRVASNKNNDFISPADSKLLVYKIEEDSTFNIKGKQYTLERMLRDKKLASEYSNGYCLVFRLSVDDYHRYSYIDDGVFLREKKINGLLHTVGPIAFDRYKVFCENQREYSVLNTKNFGQIVQMEVGALMVGKIVNHNYKTFKRGDEKGYFLFGGSTVIILVKDGIVEIDNDILGNSRNSIETKIKALETIGKKIRSKK